MARKNAEKLLKMTAECKEKVDLANKEKTQTLEAQAQEYAKKLALKEKECNQKVADNEKEKNEKLLAMQSEN